MATGAVPRRSGLYKATPSSHKRTFYVRVSPFVTRASMYSILRSRAVSFSFSVASLERQDISGKRMWFKDKVSSNKDMDHETPKSSPSPQDKAKGMEEHESMHGADGLRNGEGELSVSQ